VTRSYIQKEKSPNLKLKSEKFLKYNEEKIVFQEVGLKAAILLKKASKLIAKPGFLL